MWEKANSNSILAIIADLNEEHGIGLTIAELRRYLEKPWILVVDGNSRDRTAEVAKELYADVIFQEGKGKGDAIAQAIRYVNWDVDYAVLTDADYTYPAEYLPQMIRILDENPNVGMVCGNRFNHHLNVGAMKDAFNFGNKLLAFSHTLLNGVALRDPLTGLRVIRWEILKGWTPKSKGFDIEVELNHHVERKGLGIVEVDIPYRIRIGEKKLKLKHGVTIMRRILSESVY
jgi:glycosyltransferase involved in cell wall biosynthesis